MLNELQEDKSAFKDMVITFEEKTFTIFWLSLEKMYFSQRDKRDC